jgi:hypothetical protein
MMMTEFDKDSQDDLAEFFEAAKRQSPDLPAGLAERILQDADQVQEGYVIHAQNRPATSGLFHGLRDVLGGWPAVAGLMTACTAGVWLGFAPPDSLPDAFVISSLIQDNIDMFDADGLTTGWNEYSAFNEGSVVE